MPQYCQIDDVQRLIKWTRFQYNNVLDPGDVEEFIKEAEAEVESRLSKKYQLPIAEDDKRIVKFIVVRLASFSIAKVLVVQAGGDIPETVLEWKNEAEARLKQILDDEVQLPETPEDPQWKPDGGLLSIKSSEPYWKKNTDQW